MTQELAPRLDPRAIEPERYRRWMEGGYFHVPASAVLEEGREPYVIVIPPPNVTAALHMGHGLNDTVQDVLIRWRRMQGRATLWVPGTDHAGIATQNVVERRLAAEGISREELGREEFLRRMWEFVTVTGGTILEQIKAIGASCDWQRTRFTLDDDLQRAVREVFVSLYEKGLIYRGKYIINWCPRCLTALSNEEAEAEETAGTLWHLRYPLAASAAATARSAAGAEGAAVGQLPDGRWYLTVSTTRPETMLGDTGVAVHPDDPRYKALVGSQVELPLTGRTSPVVADAAVDPAFGSGFVKITPAHDQNDFEIAGRTGLAPLDVMTPDARMSDAAGERFRGLDRFDARKAVLAALAEQGLLAGEQVHAHSVPHCYRCHTVVEPRLSEQWFVKMKPLAQPALEASRNGTVSFTPKHWQGVYEHWMENIRDWCISRQLWWGHRIPVWYRGEELVVSLERPEGEGWTQDEDVLDTWFSSWLWPFATLGWPEKTPDLARYYPNSLMITGSDIIFFWVARMIMAGYEFADGAPFPHVFFTSIVRDTQGRKMSKSLGNSPDPLAMMDRFGADAVRFTMIYLTPTGQDLQFEEKRVETGKFFANKVWNAARLVSLRLGDEDLSKVRETQLKLTLADRWILSRFAHAVKATTRYLKTYRFNEAANAVYHFTWNEYCDWYLEMAKPRWGYEEDQAVLTPEQVEDRRAARWVAWKVLDGILRLLHPFMPFVTEEIWQSLPHDGELLATAAWPRSKSAWTDAEAERQVAFLRELVVAVRNLRVENGLPVGRLVPVTVRGSGEQLDLIERLAGQIRPLARIESLTLSRDGSRPAVAASAVVQGAEVFLPLEGLVDLDEERARLAREAGKLLGDLESTKKKLRNQDFLNKARPEIVEKERARLASLEETLDKLKRAQESLRSVPK